MNFNSVKPIDWERGCSVSFDIFSGVSEQFPMMKKYLSDMEGMYLDQKAYEQMLLENNRLMYEYHGLDIPQTEGDLSFGYSVLNPGKVGDEYFFTKGHYHNLLNTAEVYHCLRGHGYIMLENKDGDWQAIEVLAGDICYVPKGYAHRSINISSDEPFVTMYAFRADAGHDYGTIRTKGFRKLLIERDGQPVIIDNPRGKDK